MVDRGRIRALFSVSDCHAPAVSPSGDAIAYRQTGAGGTELRLADPESGTDRLLGADLPPIGQAPLYWLPDGDQVVSVGGTADDQVVDLVARDGTRDRLADVDGRAWLFDTEPGAVWYWTVDEATLYRHPVEGDRGRVASVDPVESFNGGVSGDRVALTRRDDGTPAPHVLSLAGDERRLDGAAGWATYAKPWIDEGRLLLWRRHEDGVGVYDLGADRFAWRDESVDRPVTTLPDGEILALRDWTPVVGNDGDWRELPVDGAAVISPMAADEILLPDGRAVITRKSSTRPQEFVALELDTGDAELLVEADFGSVDPDGIVAPESVTYPTAEGTEADALLWRPSDDGPFPAVVTMYPAQPDPTPGLDWSVQLLVEAGYAVCFAGHRGTYLEAHRDYAAAGEWLADHPDVDGDRVGVYGHSDGGEAALRQAFRYPGVWDAVVAWAGRFDLVGTRETDTGLPSAKLAQLPDYDEDPETWETYSPATHADRLDVPLLALYGRRDPIIPVANGRWLLETVPDDAPLEYHELDAGHVGDIGDDVTVWTTTLEFLDRRLGPDHE
jgi:dipeptidyl aminopeptidase/acylaminoacyl peptidase